MNESKQNNNLKNNINCYNNYSDILSEIIEKHNIESDANSSLINYNRHGKEYHIDSFVISTKQEELDYGKMRGIYHILTINDIRDVSDVTKNKYITLIQELLIDLLPALSDRDTVLVVGLGNDKIESDSLGNMVCDQIIVTRNLILLDGKPKISVFSPSVMGRTGIETSDTISSIAKLLKPKCVIVIDSLCASSPKRLGKSIQITNAGITPGAGVNNVRSKISRNTIGCDVITIGIPLMIYAKTFCKNMCDIDPNLVVTYSDISEVVTSLSRVIARAINKTLIGIERL